MPNGISCVYFAIKNHQIAKDNKNFFREGIAGIQTTRSLSCAADALPVANFVKNSLNNIASVLKKLVYPLIIASGIYTTAKSDDKVKTGLSQAGSIGTMFVFENIAEKILNPINSRLQNTNAIKNHKGLRALLYIGKGAAYILASMGGYNLGNKGASYIVDKIRDNKKTKTLIERNTNEKFPIENDLSEENIESTLFQDIESTVE